MQDFYIYILECNDGTYYVGQTDNLESRIAAHNIKYFPYCYTASRLPVKLVFMQEFAARTEAVDAERRIKKWSHSKKQALINQNIDALKSLSKKIFDKNK